MNSGDARVNYSSVGSRTRLKYPLETKVEAVPRCKSEDFDVDGSRLTSHRLTMRTRSRRCRSRSIIRRRRLSAPQRRYLARNFSASDRDAFRASSADGTSFRHSLARNSERRRFIDEDGIYIDAVPAYADARWELQRSAFRQPVLRANDHFQGIIASAFHASLLAAPSVLVHVPMVYLLMPREVDRGRRASQPCLTDDSHFQ